MSVTSRKELLDEARDEDAAIAKLGFKLRVATYGMDLTMWEAQEHISIADLETLLRANAGMQAKDEIL